MKRFVFALFALATLLVLSTEQTSAGTDTTPGQQGNEPTTTVVSPQNPAQVAAMQGCTVTISNNFGLTWPITRNSTIAPCNGDPTMAFDSQGRLFVSHLSFQGVDNELSLFAGQIADITTAGTANYTPIQVSANDGNGDDKQWLAADTNPQSPYRDNLYLVWTDLSGNNAILFSRSVNQGATWSAEQVLSVAGEGFVWPSHVAVGPNGDVYVSYHANTCGAANTGATPLLVDGFGGQNFAAGTVPQRNNAFAAGAATVTCNVQGSGNEIPGTDFWLQGSMQPWILPDPVRAGNVYVVGNDDPNNTYANGDDADVVIARSTDNGVTFTTDRVDHSPGQTFAVMPTAHIDQDGNIAVHWYDNRGNISNAGTSGFANGAANFLLDVYGTASIDGGLTFSNDFQINDLPYDPDVGAPCRWGPAANVPPCQNVPAGGTTLNTTRIGEYNGVWTVDGLGYAVWTGNATPPNPPGTTNGAGVQTTYFDIYSNVGIFRDRFEPNESRNFAVAAALGAGSTFNESRLTLHTASDVDFFKVVALHTGDLEAEIEFNERIADLEVRVFDGAGNVIATGNQTTLQTGSSTESLSIPVVQGEEYFVEAFDPNAPNTLPAQSSYDLTIINRPAPVPFALDLLASSDTGSNSADNITGDNTPDIRLRVDVVDAANRGIPILDSSQVGPGVDGYAVAIFVNGVFEDYADPIALTNDTLWAFTFTTPLADGPNSITAKVRVFDGATPQANGFGGESDALNIEVDTTGPGSGGGPAVCATPDLIPTSDDAGINDDNVTRIQSPAFSGSGDAGALVRIFSGATVIGSGTVGADSSLPPANDGIGAWEVTVEPLADGVHPITCELSDNAGNVSSPGPPLNVTIANQTLNLGGTGAVTVDLADGAVSGNPPTVSGIPSPSATTKIGILDIPLVNLDINGNALTILGTPVADSLTYTPLGSQAGSVVRGGSLQVLNFSEAAGTFTVDPLAGADILNVIATVATETTNAILNTTSSVQVGALKTVSMPAANMERILVDAGQGDDTVNVTAFNSVNARITVIGGLPSSNPNLGDHLHVQAGSPKAQIKKQPGIKSLGTILVTYPQTTGNQSRIDYMGIEKITMSK